MDGDPELAAMTVNERLVSVGLMAEWDAAVSRRDRAEMIRLLTLVKVLDPDVTVDAVLANPTFYGFPPEAV